jgi:hypothetical protein
MDVVCLTSQDHALLCARFAEHGNSQRRMRDALRDVHAARALERLCALRAMERRFGVDLGAVCWRWQHRADPQTHPLEHSVMSYIAERRNAQDGWELWIRLDRVHQLRELMAGGLVGERE